eukprot:CAMPEP_0117425464 /NCGR_PEP_ID=MMETSP0758-20121206/5725_1 /TAXON_ID=63605 /ORGANISM="Percolomonas cosmopolitus, Strain AE-1 (ATCC 50343)" /LENGTH=288 /DNA_ID=CAMNT_0005209953 /DNA_START=220 /DNA_END=1082 /DNA_ORIENTATION=-
MPEKEETELRQLSHEELVDFVKTQEEKRMAVKWENNTEKTFVKMVRTLEKYCKETETLRIRGKKRSDINKIDFEEERNKLFKEIQPYWPAVVHLRKKFDSIAPRYIELEEQQALQKAKEERRKKLAKRARMQNGNGEMEDDDSPKKVVIKKKREMFDLPAVIQSFEDMDSNKILTFDVDDANQVKDWLVHSTAGLRVKRSIDSFTKDFLVTCFGFNESKIPSTTKARATHFLRFLFFLCDSIGETLSFGRVPKKLAQVVRCCMTNLTDDQWQSLQALLEMHPMISKKT